MQSDPYNSVFIQIKNLTLRRHGYTVIDDMTMDLPQNGLILLLGANGAGKSSLLRVLAGVSHATEGTVNIPASLRIAWVPEPACFYRHLTVHQQLLLQADLMGLSTPYKAVDAGMDQWDLNSVKNQLTSHLSLGYRQRLSIACALLAPSDVLLLDEPMNGMDPELMHKFKGFLADFKQRQLVLMATHLMAEVSELTDQAWVLHQGKILAKCDYQQPASATDLLQLYQASLAEWQKGTAI